MADLKWYKVNRVVKNKHEADRDVDGYRADPEDIMERRAILIKEKSKDNRTYICHECLLEAGDDRSMANKIRAYYKKRYGKTMRRDATLGSVILPFPRVYLPVDYMLTNVEYSALCRELEGKEKDIDSEALKSAHEKLLSRDFSDAEKMQIYGFFEKYIDVFCMAFGIKREDILYATLHMDESNPHLHLCFFPSVYIKDQQAWKEYRSFPGKKELPKELYGDCNRIIDDEEQPVGCSQKRFTMGFLHYLNANMEKGFKERGINVKLSTGRGQIIDVQKASKPLREAAAIARGVEEESKRRNADLQSEIAMQEGKLKKLEAQIEEKETVIKNLKKEINRAKEKLAGLTEAILEAKEILEGMCSRVKGLISSGLDRIKRAKSHKEKEDVAKAAEEQLIRIKTDADAVMTMFMPYDDEEEEKGKADPEKEYDGDERDDM